MLRIYFLFILFGIVSAYSSSANAESRGDSICRITDLKNNFLGQMVITPKNEVYFLTKNQIENPSSSQSQKNRSHVINTIEKREQFFSKKIPNQQNHQNVIWDYIRSLNNPNQLFAFLSVKSPEQDRLPLTRQMIAAFIIDVSNTTCLDYINFKTFKSVMRRTTLLSDETISINDPDNKNAPLKFLSYKYYDFTSAFEDQLTGLLTTLWLEANP